MTTAVSNGTYASEKIGSEVEKHGGLVVVHVVVEGITPLMMNAMSQEQLLKIRDKVKAPKTAAKPTPREEANSKAHVLPDGRPHVPGKCLLACLINAGQFVRLDGKRQISTEKKTVLPSMLTLLSKEIPLVIPGTKNPSTWEVDIQQGRNPNGGEAVCIVRPRFDQWSLVFDIEVDQSLMPLSMARDLIDIAGRRIGLMEFTPRRKGTFGCFRVTKWEINRIVTLG